MPDEQIIYLDPNDELTKVRERIEEIPARHIILVVPQQTQLRSHVGWRLLHAAARSAPPKCPTPVFVQRSCASLQLFAAPARPSFFTSCLRPRKASALPARTASLPSARVAKAPGCFCLIAKG